MVIISNYSILKEAGQSYSVWSGETHVCPSCKKSELHCIGRRMRSVVEKDGITRKYLLWRLRCSKCNRIHHELPDFLVPFKRYSIKVIVDIIANEINAVPCSDTTIRNIRHWFLKFILPQLAQAFQDPKSINTLYSLPSIKLISNRDIHWLKWAIQELVSRDKWFTTRLMC